MARKGRLPQPFTPPASYRLGRGLRNENDEFGHTQVINLRYTVRTQINTPNRPLTAHEHTTTHKRRDSPSIGNYYESSRARPWHGRKVAFEQ